MTKEKLNAYVNTHKYVIVVTAVAMLSLHALNQVLKGKYVVNADQNAVAPMTIQWKGDLAKVVAADDIYGYVTFKK